MSSFAIPPVLLERMVRLGDRIRTARIRRGWSVSVLEAIELLADPDRDLHGKALEASRRAHRVHGGQASDTNSYDF